MTLPTRNGVFRLSWNEMNSRQQAESTRLSVNQEIGLPAAMAGVTGARRITTSVLDKIGIDLSVGGILQAGSGCRDPASTCAMDFHPVCGCLSHAADIIFTFKDVVT
jgi:hypothetical protein